MNYNIYSCSICNETRIDMKITNNICDRCTKDKLPIKMFSKENNMDPGVVPPELKDLTIVEQQLISRISPCIITYVKTWWACCKWPLGCFSTGSK